MVEDFSGVKHHLGECSEFGAVHAANPHGHEPRGHLVIGYFPARVAGNEKIDFFGGEFSGITFLRIRSTARMRLESERRA